MSDAEQDPLKYTCYTCDATFQSPDEMEYVEGSGNRSGRHFCGDCSERVDEFQPARSYYTRCEGCQSHIPTASNYCPDCGRDRMGDDEGGDRDE